MARRPAVRALQIAIPLTLVLVVAGLTIVVSLSKRPVTDDVIVDFIAAMIVLSLFAFPLVFAGAWASLQWPGLLSGSMLWPTILLGVLSLWWLFDDLRRGRTVALGDVALVWMILWPLAVILTFARRAARAGGHAIAGAIREKWTERS
jgi:hypothetical protein